MENLLQQSERIHTKWWEIEVQSLQVEYDSMGKEQSKVVIELDDAQVISYKKSTFKGRLGRRGNSKIDNRAKSNEEEKTLVQM